MATKRTVMVPFGGVVVTFTKVDQTAMLPFGGAVVDAKIVAAAGGTITPVAMNNYYRQRMG